MVDMEIQNLGFFNDSIPMELPHTLYEWLNHQQVRVQGWLHVLQFFGHLSLTLKSPPMNADHHPCFLLIYPYFIAMFHLEILFFP